MASAWYVGFFRTASTLVPGAVVLAAAFPVHDPVWVRLAVGIGVVVAGPLVHDFDAAQGAKGAPFMLLALAAIGGYYTVPDTELPLVLLGVALPLALLSVPQPLRKLGPAGSAAAVGAFVWVAAVGGRGRAASVLATVAALGLLLVEPLARRVPRSTVALGKKRRQRSRQSDNWLLVIGTAAVVDLAFAAFAAKIVGRTTDTVLAVVMVAPGPGAPRRRRAVRAAQSGRGAQVPPRTAPVPSLPLDVGITNTPVVRPPIAVSIARRTDRL